MLAAARSAKEASNSAKSNKFGVFSQNQRGKALNREGILEAEILRKPDDIREDPKYEGQTQIFLTRVPNHSVDMRREMDAKALREWIIYAVIEEDPYAQRFFDEIHKLTKIIADVEKNLLSIPKLQFFDQNGQPMPDDQARVEREKLFTKYGEERILAEGKLEDAEKALKTHVAWRKTTTVLLEQCEIDNNTDTSTWRFKLAGIDDADEIEDLLCQKLNWNGIKLTLGDQSLTPPLLPWAGRGALPSSEGKNYSYDLLKVNMLGVRVRRAPQGIGFT
eukprot:gene40446-49294_t